jgi:hypothetical protein
MGGFGSGPTASTPIVGKCHTINIDHLTDSLASLADADRDALPDEHPVDDLSDPPIPYRWSDEHGHGEEVASVGLYPAWDRDHRFTPTLDGVNRADRADALDGRPTDLRLAYTVTPSEGDPTECEYRTPLEYTPCNFGGVRPWFRCLADGYGERVGKLPRPSGRDLFACRECYELGYLTSRRSGDALKKTELRYQRAFRKVDAKDRRPHPNNAPQWPTKPKGMHGETFADLDDAREAWERAFDQRLREMADGLDGLV